MDGDDLGVPAAGRSTAHSNARRAWAEPSTPTRTRSTLASTGNGPRQRQSVSWR